MSSLTGSRQGKSNHEQGDDANGQIDVENPAPGEGIDKKASKEGSGHA